MPDPATAPRLAGRPLGATGLHVSPLALAALSMASGLGGPGLHADDVERAYHEHGVNTFLVTRQMKQQTEGVRRLARSGRRDDLVIVSMASLPIGWSVRRAWEKNAAALGVERIDVFLLGWVRWRCYVTGRTWPAMRRLQEEGKVRAIGFSCHDRPLALDLARELAVDVLMIRYNAAHRGAERQLFEPLGPRRPGILAYTATRWGMLMKPQPERGFPSGMTAPECYRFALGHPAVDAVLCAPCSPGELREDVAGVRLGALDPVRDAEVRRFGDAVHAASRGGYRWMFAERPVAAAAQGEAK